MEACKNVTQVRRRGEKDIRIVALESRFKRGGSTTKFIVFTLSLSLCAVVLRGAWKDARVRFGFDRDEDTVR